MRRRLQVLCAITLLMLTTMMLPALPSAAQGTDDESTFQDLLAQLESAPLVFGPESGALLHDPDRITVAEAGVDVADFALHVEFENPYSAAETPWDFGAVLRLSDDPDHYQLVIRSTGEWRLSIGSGDPVNADELEGLTLRAGQPNTLDVIAVGDTGYFAVNDNFVSTLDLSDVTGSGNVAIGTSFHVDDFQEGASTGYSNYQIWSLDEIESTDETATPSGQIGRSDTPVATEESTEEPDGDDSTPSADAGVYESPTFGYSFTYDDSWAVESESSEDGVDFVRIGNGVSTLDFTGFSHEMTATECVQSEFDFYDSEPGYTNVAVAQDVNDAEMRGGDDTSAFGVFWFTYTPEDDEGTDYTSYVQCESIVPGESMVKLVHFVPFDDYNDQIEERVKILDEFTFAPEDDDPSPTAEADVTPEATVENDETPEATEEAGDADSAAVIIIEVDESGVSGIATIESSTDGSEVNLLLIGAPEGAIALIHQGTCEDLDPKPAYLLELIDAGTSQTDVDASVDDLLAGPYAIAIHASVADLATPIACGDIAA